MMRAESLRQVIIRVLLRVDFKGFRQKGELRLFGGDVVPRQMLSISIIPIKVQVGVPLHTVRQYRSTDQV
jgi:hypothetical protein